MAMMAWLVIPLAIGGAGLVPAWALGRSGRGSRRPVAALWWAVALNAAAVVVPLAGYLALWLIPAACFGIAACVAGVAGRRAWLVGPLASPWFLAPWVAWWVATATPDQVAAYGRLPVDALMLSLPFGILGGLAAEATLSLRSFLGHPPG